MRRFFAARSLFLCIVSVLAVAPAYCANDLRSFRNEYFEVVGLDLRSVSQVNELSAITADIAMRYLDRESLAYPLPILVSLRPEAYVEFEGDYRIRLEERASVQLDLRWEPSLSFETTVRAISEALLTQYLLYNYGPRDQVNLPAWTLSALSTETLVSLRPSWFHGLVTETRRRDLPEVASIIVPTLPSEETAPNFGYWLTLSLKSSGIERGTIRSLFQMSLAGVDIEEALTQAVQSNEPDAEPVDADAWWRLTMEALLSREYERVESMQETREWLTRLAKFDEPVITDSEEVQLTIRSLWTHREAESIRTMIEARYEILRLRMARANPAYFNAAQSLGTLFEAILDEAPAHRYIHALAIYLSDMEDAKEMEEVVHSKINLEM